MFSADHGGAVLEPERGDRVGAGDFSQGSPRLALDRHLGDLCSWNRPTGGYFIWVRVPDACDLSQLDALAAAAGINYGPGRAFHAGDQPVPYFRLSFAYPSLEEIEAGVAEMARCVRAALPRPAGARARTADEFAPGRCR